MAVKTLDNERELLIEVAHGDQRAFTIIYEFYQHKIYTFCLPILHSEELAEEVVQETLLRIWRMGQQLKTIDHLDGYIKSIARNRAIDLLRHQKLKEKSDLALSKDWREDQNETEEQIILNDTRNILKQGVDLLPKQQKMVYQLAKLEGLKNEEIAKQLNLAPSTVETHLKLAMRFLRQYVKQHTDIAILILLLKL